LAQRATPPRAHSPPLQLLTTHCQPPQGSEKAAVRLRLLDWDEGGTSARAETKAATALDSLHVAERVWK